MRRILLTLAKIFAVIAAAFLLCGSARAEGSGEYGDINSALSDAVPPEASEILEGGGITPDNNGAAALSFGGVLEFLRNMLMDRLTEPLRLFASLCGVVILCALSRSSADGAGGNMSGVFSAVGVLAGAGMTTAAISGALRDTLDVLSAASEFMLVFVPVFAGVIAAMGKAAAASAANTVILAAAQFFSQISVNFLTPVCGTVMGLSVTGAIHPEMSTDKLGELIRKAAVWGLSLLMTVFMSVLSAQTFVTNSADNVLIRTAKFAVSSGVPIVGGTISDAVNTVHASLSLMHSSIGTYGIAAGIVILLPSLISVVCYRFALTAAEAVSEVFGVKELSTLFRACGAVMSIIMAVIVCFPLLNTISAVIMLAAGLFILAGVNALRGTDFDLGAVQYSYEDSADYIGFSGDVNRELQKKICSEMSDKVYALLNEQGICPEEVHIAVNISGLYSISITQVELVFSGDQRSSAEAAEELLTGRLPEEIRVTSVIRE